MSYNGHGETEAVVSGGGSMIRRNEEWTIGQNIDAKIKHLKEQIVRLEATRERMPKEFLAMTIYDLSEALQPAVY